MKTLYNKSKVITACRQGGEQKSKKSILLKIILPLSILLFTLPVEAQVYSEKDIEICNSKFQLAIDNDLDSLPIGDLIAEIGNSFIGTDYLAHGIEKNGNEQLVINLTGLDCTTFLENSLVISRCIKKRKTSFEDFQKELKFIRYRGGIVDEYPSRLHYFSDWIYDNIAKGVVRDVTEDIGGKKIIFDLNFMSTHPESYKHLIENAEFIPVIEKQEEEISCREYSYIPKEELESKEKLIKNGDLIALTTTIMGLDIGHVGIAIKMDYGRIHLLHAPTESEKVQISTDPIADYLMKFKKHSGIIVLRAIELTP